MTKKKEDKQHECMCGGNGECQCGHNHEEGHSHDAGCEKCDMMEQKYLRALADYQNLEKRVETLKTDTEKRTKIRILSSFLDVLDHLEKAETFMDDDGLKMISNQFRKTIEELGLEEIDLLDKEYDPYVAEAIDVVDAKDHDGKDNIVIEVVKKGYKVGDEVIRPAHVRVAKVKN